MSGKTRQKGLSGLLDITGQGLESTANDLMNVALAQKNQDMVLAQAFLKSKADAAKAAQAGPGFVGGDKVFRIEDPKYPGQFYNVKGMRGKDGRNYVLNRNNEVSLAPPGAVGYEAGENKDKIALYASNLEENKRGAEMIDFVIDMLPEAGTFNAAYGLAKEDLFGTFEQAFGTNGITGSDFDAEIKSLMRNNEDQKVADKLIENYDKDMAKADERAREMFKDARKDMGGGFLSRPTDEQLATFSKLALIEQRMKYLVANANKAQDRLTQKDIENAAQRTGIIKFYGSAKTVRQNYMNLKNEFEQKAESFAMSYRQNGGTESSMQYFRENVPGVQNLYDQKKKEFLEKERLKNKNNRNNILTTLPGVQ